MKAQSSKTGKNFIHCFTNVHYKMVEEHEKPFSLVADFEDNLPHFVNTVRWTYADMKFVTSYDA